MQILDYFPRTHELFLIIRETMAEGDICDRLKKGRMDMKNRNQFIPKSAPIQPVGYRYIAGSWEAIFSDKMDNEYIIRMNPVHGRMDEAKTVTVLRQLPMHRMAIALLFQALKKPWKR